MIFKRMSLGGLGITLTIWSTFLVTPGDLSDQASVKADSTNLRLELRSRVLTDLSAVALAKVEVLGEGKGQIL
jgi:hypothetical protein